MGHDFLFVGVEIDDNFVAGAYLACEKEFGDLKKGSMVKYLEKYGEGGAPAEDDEDDEWEL